MLIAFDGRYAENDLVGIGKYIKYLVSHVGKKEIRCVVFFSKKPKHRLSGKNISTVILKTSNKYIFEQILVPLEILRRKVDIYHVTGNTGVPLLCPIPTVLTVHDLIPLEIKNYFSDSRYPFISKLIYTFRLWSSLQKANRVVAISKCVKKQILTKFGNVRNKIKMINSGICIDLDPNGDLPKILIGKKYILNHGGIDARKNLANLMLAFAKIKKKNKSILLVITGKNNRLEKELINLAKKLKIIDSVVFTGYVNEQMLINLIGSSEMVCYPSLFEGFGFPVLEAYGLGIPVITSKTSALREIGTGAAILVDPKSTTQISSAIEQVLKDAKLRKRMIIAGKRRFLQYSWEKSANEYLTLYNSIK